MKDYSYKSILQKLKDKFNLSLSYKSLLKIFKQNNLKRKNIVESPIEEIVLAILLKIQGSGRLLGYRFMWQRLRKVYLLNVKQKTICFLLKIIDEEGVEYRSRYRLKRRCYSVPGPNYVWHADGHDKLKRYANYMIKF